MVSAQRRFRPSLAVCAVGMACAAPPAGSLADLSFGHPPPPIRCSIADGSGKAGRADAPDHARAGSFPDSILEWSAVGAAIVAVALGVGLRRGRNESSFPYRALDEHVIVSITDPQGRITYANEKFCDISNYSAEELQGRDHRVVNSGLHPSTFFEELWAAITRGEVWKGDICNRAKGGGLYWVTTTVMPNTDRSGRITEYIALQTDITEAKRREQELHEKATALQATNQALEAAYAREQEITASREILNSRLARMVAMLEKANTDLQTEIAERRRAEETVRRTSHTLSSILRSATEYAIVATDTDFRVVHYNPAAERLFGLEAKAVIGRTVHEIRTWKKSRWERFRTAVETVEERGIYECDIESAAPDGSRQFLHSTAMLMTDEQENTLGYLVVAREVTARRLAEEKLRIYASQLEATNHELHAAKNAVDAAVAELKRSNQELDDFAYIASHDLKEPLRGIHNYSIFLLEDYADKLDEEGRARLSTLPRLTQRLEAFIDALLRFSRLGRTELGIVQTDLNEVLADVLDSLHITLAEQGVDVRVPRPLPVVRCDQVRVAEVFRNLITNAMKYNDKPDKWIEVGYTEDAGNRPAGQDAERVFHVRDNGIGIREKHLDAPFRILKRLHGRDKYGGGTGVGLTIVKKIVERHGGRVWVESTYGQGSTFFFTLQGAPQRDHRDRTTDAVHPAH